ncbi:hypothetical protein B0T22DRAFT_536364 [Podospora appendiculata]|uniref:Uncharacterized protein n=1 Tax=Podospora appendiculata TaxID=314037 RepID=A0AAE1CDH6_9PEZI|nr:hypothetical protein B0T22DRAFT_536364 [Podospora appendiculata]
MGSPYIIGDASPFMKRVLVPFWVVRIIVMLFEIALYAFVIGVVASYYHDHRGLVQQYGDNASVNTLIAVLAVIMTLVAICLILDIVCIVKRARRTLSPRFFLIVNVIQTTLWVIWFVMSMIGANSPLSIGVAVIIFLSFLGLLIYSSVIFHRFRKGKLGAGNYVQAHNPEVHGLVGQPQNTGYANYPLADPFPQAPVAAEQKPAYYDAPVAYTHMNNNNLAYEPNHRPL